MKCERCGKELEDIDLYCPRCGKAVFEKYMDEEDVWVYYKSDEELARIMQEEGRTWSPAENAPDPEIPEKEQEKEETDISPEEAISSQEMEQPETEEISKQPAEPEQEMTTQEEPEEETEEKAEEADLLPAPVLPEKAAEEEETEEEAAAEKEELILPEQKRSKRYAVAVCSVFLATCLCIGLFLGYLRMKEMERQEQAYYQTLSEASQKQASENEALADQGFQLEEFEKIDFSKYTKLSPKEATGDSVMDSEDHAYGPEKMIDGDLTSSWQEGEADLGEGTNLKIDLEEKHAVRYLVFFLGNWKSEEMWEYNSRPHQISLEIGTEKMDLEFSDEKKEFCVSFEEPIETDSLSITLISAYKGSRWEDTCISEIQLYEEKLP